MGPDDDYEQYEASPYNGDDLDGGAHDEFYDSDDEDCYDATLDQDDQPEYDDPMTYNEDI